MWWKNRHKAVDNSRMRGIITDVVWTTYRIRQLYSEHLSQNRSHPAAMRTVTRLSVAAHILRPSTRLVTLTERVLRSDYAARAVPGKLPHAKLGFGLAGMPGRVRRGIIL